MTTLTSPRSPYPEPRPFARSPPMETREWIVTPGSEPVSPKVPLRWFLFCFLYCSWYCCLCCCWRRCLCCCWSSCVGCCCFCCTWFRFQIPPTKLFNVHSMSTMITWSLAEFKPAKRLQHQRVFHDHTKGKMMILQKVKWPYKRLNDDLTKGKMTIQKVNWPYKR